MHTRLSDTHSQEPVEMRELFIVVDDNSRIAQNLAVVNV